MRITVELEPFEREELEAVIGPGYSHTFIEHLQERDISLSSFHGVLQEARLWRDQYGVSRTDIRVAADTLGITFAQKSDASGNHRVYAYDPERKIIGDTHGYETMNAAEFAVLDQVILPSISRNQFEAGQVVAGFFAEPEKSPIPVYIESVRFDIPTMQYIYQARDVSDSDIQAHETELGSLGMINRETLKRWKQAIIVAYPLDEIDSAKMIYASLNQEISHRTQPFEKVGESHER
jgi:hypothetical protein